MNLTYRILAINPGSTSTKIAVFENETKRMARTIEHDPGELEKCTEMADQKSIRRDMILKVLKDEGYTVDMMDCFVGRGGSIEACEGGVYAAEGLLLEHARTCRTAVHPASLGAVLAHEFSSVSGKPAYIVDPPAVDEFEDISRITGLKGIYRESSFHALNQKAVGRLVADKLGKSYDTVNLIIAHIGGGISVSAHRHGRVIDSNDIIRGDGPMAPTRCGGLPVKAVVRMCFSGYYTELQMMDFCRRNGGMVDHLGTSDIREVKGMIESGNTYAKLVYDAMIYQIGKGIGSCAASLSGAIDAVVLTGGIVNDPYVVTSLKNYIGFLAPVEVIPGELEMEALASGALRVLRGTEELKKYTGKPVWDGFLFESAKEKTKDGQKELNNEGECK